MVVLGGYLLASAGTPGTPSRGLWISLILLLAVGVSVAAAVFAVDRALHRRTQRRQALQAVTAPLVSPTATDDTSERPNAPGPRPRVNAREAELLARDWMRHLGADDALTTPDHKDGGVDVRSRHYVAQVKHYTSEPVGVPAIRQLYGVACAEHRHALFFASSGYTRDALAFARENDIALFIPRHHEGRLVAHGTLAQHYLTHGLRTLPHPLGR